MAELAGLLGSGAVTLAVGPTRKERGRYPGDPGAGLLPGFRDAEPLVEGQEVPVEGAVCPVGRQRPVCFPGPAESLGLAYAPQSAGRAARKPAVASPGSGDARAVWTHNQCTQRPLSEGFHL